jgi:hypothetical protein
MGITETNIRKLLSIFGVNQTTPQTLKGVKGILDTALPPVPFSFSALAQSDAGGYVAGLTFIGPGSLELDAAQIGSGEGQLTAFVVYLDTQRGTYWGDIDISVTADAIYDVTIALPTIDATQCNNLVTLAFNGAASAGQSYPFTITAESGKDFSISRTFTINTITEA